MSKEIKKKKKNLYRILNFELGKWGEPFALCDKCFEKWKEQIGGKIYYSKIGENTNLPCNQCGT